MNLDLKRTRMGTASTIGELSVNGKFECYICEDVVREVDGMPVGSWKVPGLTAIPRGLYRVVHTMSARFKRVLPELLNVPGFAGIRIHPGNTAADTEGCLLPGEKVSPDGAGVMSSRNAFVRLDTKLINAFERGEEVWIKIQ